MRSTRRIQDAVSRRFPFADANSFSDWLILGLLGFNRRMAVSGLGDERAFPGYSFSIETDIPSQFSEFFEPLPDRTKLAVRNGLTVCLERLRSHPEWLEIILADVIQIGLGVVPGKTVTQSTCYLPFVREIATQTDYAEDIEALNALYIAIVAELSNVDKVQRRLYSVLQRECFCAGHPFRDAVPLLCTVLTEYEPQHWLKYVEQAGDLIWPRDVLELDFDGLERFAMVMQRIVETAGPSLVASSLHKLVPFLIMRTERGRAFLGAIFTWDFHPFALSDRPRWRINVASVETSNPSFNVSEGEDLILAGRLDGFLMDLIIPDFESTLRRLLETEYADAV